MLKNSSNRFFYPLLLVLFSLLACAIVAPATSTPTVPPATNTPLPTPTKTVQPTFTPRPTATPNIVATEIYDNLFSKVQMFKDEGFIPSTSGTYIQLDDFREDFAQIGYLYPEFPENLQLENFVFNANVKWSTAVETSDTSGCGLVFAYQEGGKYGYYYGVVLDKSRIYFSSTNSLGYKDLGKTRGTGRLNFGNPAEAELTLLVYDYRAFVYVDNEFIGEYTLSMDRDLYGYFGFGIISGTNRDYGTRCEISRPRIWKLNP
jgi:hypothetical protein